MSIITKSFNYSSVGANLPDVAEWMNENATDLFGSVTYDEDSTTLSMYDDDGNLLGTMVTSDAYVATYAYYNNGGNLVTTYASSTSGRSNDVYQLIKTDKALAISFFKSGSISSNYYGFIIITKNSAGATVFVMPDTSSPYGVINDSSQPSSYSCITYADARYTAGTYATNYCYSISTTAMTTLTPFTGYASATYTPYVFFAALNKYRGAAGTVLIDGVYYWTNGFIYLMDE